MARTLEKGAIVRSFRPTIALSATIGLLAGLGAVLAGSGPAGAATATSTAALPRPDHVVFVLFENTSAG
jgi:hypothetical protein